MTGHLVETKALVDPAWRLQDRRPPGGLPSPSMPPGDRRFSKQLRAAVLCLVCGAWQIKTAGRRVYILPWQ